MEKKCKQCERLVVGRSDKKFCSDACRIDHHNQQKKDAYDFRKDLIRVSEGNRKLLHQLLDEGIDKFKTEELLAKGFNFNGITGIAPKAKQVEIYCFEYRLVKKGEWFLLSLLPASKRMK